MALMSTRDPYPFPRQQNDSDFCGNYPQQVATKTNNWTIYHDSKDVFGVPVHIAPKTNSWTIYQDSKEVYGVPVHLAQQQDPWNRLNCKHTLSSSRHEVYHFDPQAPRDNLDFNLTATYNQQKELLRNRNQTVFQRETFEDDHGGRKLKNREVIPPKKIPLLNHPLTINTEPKMESIHSIKNAIESYHTQSTNKGYCRKPDGGFFTS